MLNFTNKLIPYSVILVLLASFNFNFQACISNRGIFYFLDDTEVLFIHTIRVCCI